MRELVTLDAVPALIARERHELAVLTDPAAVADMEKRMAAIADLTKRAGLAVPIQNEATFLRAEALQRLAVLVDEGQANGELAKPGDNPIVRDSDNHKQQLPVSRQRIAEGRSLARTGALEEMKRQAEKQPDKPVSMDAILKQSKRREREDKMRTERDQRDRTARDEIAAASELPYQLHHVSVADWRPEGVAAIITDPPYVGDSIPLYEQLREFAVDVLPEGGALVVMTWQAILPAVIRTLEHPRLAYRWTICWRYANTENTADYKRRVFDCWKPILVYHADEMPEEAPMLRDEIASHATDKDFHEWGQSVDGFERLVRTFSQPGDVVCDPFLGGGTTAVAALSQARRFLGCDISREAVATTEKRLA